MRPTIVHAKTSSIEQHDRSPCLLPADSYGLELVSRPRAFQLGPVFLAQSFARCGSRRSRRKYAAAGSTSVARDLGPANDRAQTSLVLVDPSPGSRASRSRLRISECDYREISIAREAGGERTDGRVEQTASERRSTGRSLRTGCDAIDVRRCPVDLVAKDRKLVRVCNQTPATHV